ncbi:MAG: sugar phosphate isomerase/epimerase family protein [Lachnospiraceae bacterium]
MNAKLGICNFSFPGTGVFAPRLVSEFGLDGMSIEYGSHQNGWALSQRRIQDMYLEEQQTYGIEYPNIGCSDGDNVCFFAPESEPDGAVTLRAAIGAVNAAVYMKIPLVFFSNFNASAVKTEEDFANLVARYQVICDYAEDKGIAIASENPMSALKQIELVQAVDRKNFHLFYDSDNYTFFTEYKQVDILRAIYPYMYPQLHVKDSIQGCIANAVLGTGVADFAGSIQFLKEQDYNGWLIIENLYELLPMRHLNPDYFEIVKQDVRALKDAVR